MPRYLSCAFCLFLQQTTNLKNVNFKNSYVTSWWRLLTYFNQAAIHHRKYSTDKFRDSWAKMLENVSSWLLDKFRKFSETRPTKDFSLMWPNKLWFKVRTFTLVWYWKQCAGKTRRALKLTSIFRMFLIVKRGKGHLWVWKDLKIKGAHGFPAHLHQNFCCVWATCRQLCISFSHQPDSGMSSGGYQLFFRVEPQFLPSQSPDELLR